MPILKVAELGNPILRKRAHNVGVDDVGSARIQTLIDDLTMTMREYEGAGIAAPQVHCSLRVMVFEVRDNTRYPEAPDIPLTIAINPTIEALTNDRYGMWEGCLSVPGIRGYVERPSKIRFSALDRDGNKYERIVEGFEAVAIQHECDHLDGILFIDRIEQRDKLAFTSEYKRFHCDET